MVERGEEPVEDVERVAASDDVLKDAWSRTLQDMESLADEAREGGWDVIEVAAGDTAPKSRSVGEPDEFGLVHVVPDEEAEALREAFEAGEFPRFEAYRNQIEGFVLLVTEFLDPETETAVLVAGQYQLRHAPGMVRAAEDEGEIYTHLKQLDGTLIASVRHDDWRPLVPEAVENWMD